MTPFSRAALVLLAGLALGACSTSADRFGSGADATSAAGFGSDVLGTASDPSSPAYFSETIGDRVFFEVDEHTLSSAAEATLAAQARWLTDNADFNAVIEGHADEQGTREYNLALSARRASSVQNYLIAQGVAPARLRTLPLGKERPVALCSDESCYRQNRRAVTVVSPGAVGF